MKLLGGRLDLAAHPIALNFQEHADFFRFGLALTGDGSVLRIVDEEDLPALNGLPIALGLDSRPRQVFEVASPDAVLPRLTRHLNYRTTAQKVAVRALLTQPAGSGLMVSMPTGSGKSLLFQIAANFEREATPGACAVVITPTVALALDHERTLSRVSGLEGSRTLTGDTPPAEADAILSGFRRGTVPILLLSPEKALNSSILAYLTEAAEPNSVEYGLDARLTHLFVDEPTSSRVGGAVFGLTSRGCLLFSPDCVRLIPRSERSCSPPPCLTRPAPSSAMAGDWTVTGLKSMHGCRDTNMTS